MNGLLDGIPQPDISESDSDFEVGTKKKSKRHAESDDSEEYRRKKSKKHFSQYPKILKSILW